MLHDYKDQYSTSYPASRVNDGGFSAYWLSANGTTDGYFIFYFNGEAQKTFNKLERRKGQRDAEISALRNKVLQLEEMEKAMEGEINSELGIHTKVKLVEPKSIARSEGKAKRIIDREIFNQGGG